jgi:hypothetical protein
MLVVAEGTIEANHEQRMDQISRFSTLNNNILYHVGVLVCFVKFALIIISLYIKIYCLSCKPTKHDANIRGGG